MKELKQNKSIKNAYYSGLTIQGLTAKFLHKILIK